MGALTVEERLNYARAAVVVLKTLRILDSTMRYKQFAEAIGLMEPGEKWQVQRRDQVTAILGLASATAGQAGKTDEAAALQFERIVGKDDKPGAGLNRETKIVRGGGPESAD